MRLRRAILRAKIGNVVGNIGPALPQVAGIAIDGIHVESRGDGRKNGALQPGCRLSATVQRGFHVHGRYRVVVVELDVVLARPDDFYGTAHFLREHSGLGDVIRLGLAPEPATQQCHVADHVFLRDPQLLRDNVLRRLRILRGGPRRHSAVLELRERHHGFHRGVRQ